MTYFLVGGKGDDYGASRLELVETTLKNAKAYYYYKKIEDNDVEILKKYLGELDTEEEKERTDEQRYYGN